MQTIEVAKNPPEAGIARYLGALTLTGGLSDQAVEFAKSRWLDSPEVHLSLQRRSAVNPITTEDSPLMSYGIAQDFHLLLEERSLVAGLASRMREVPFNIMTPTEGTGTVCGFSGETDAKPAKALTFSSVRLLPHKLACFAVLSRELVTRSRPDAERAVTRVLVDALARSLDSEFLSATAAEAMVRPAGILNGQPTRASSGATVANIQADVTAMSAELGSWTDVVFITRPRTAMHLGNLRLLDYVGSEARLANVPLYTSASVGARLVLIDLGQVHIAMGASDIDVSRHAHVLMDDGGSPPGTTEVSLWQQNLIAVRAERYASWRAAHNTAACSMQVAY